MLALNEAFNNRTHLKETKMRCCTFAVLGLAFLILISNSACNRYNTVLDSNSIIVNLAEEFEGDTLGYNDLINVPDNVSVLILRNNSIKYIELGTFSRFSSLRVLDLSFNHLLTIPDDLFSDLTQLSELDLGNNRLESLSSRAFVGLNNLGGLAISSNNLSAESFAEGVFDNLSNLTLLDIAINPLGSIPEGIFDSLSSLDYLSAYETGITEIPVGTFDSLSNLETLEFNENPIKSIPAGALTGLTSLKTLGLAMNRLETIPIDILNGSLPALTSLSLADNAGFVWADSSISSSIELDISRYNEIVWDGRYEFIGTLSNIEQLAEVPSDAKALILRNNGFTDIPQGTFDRFTQLEELDLGFNSLVTLPEGIFDNLTGLMALYLGYNQLNAIPADLFNKSHMLGEVSLAGNQLTLSSFSSPGTVFDNLSELFILQLEFNPLGEIPSGWFDDLASLEYLGIFNDHIVELPNGIFKNCVKLSEIDLAENELTSLNPDAFSSLPTGYSVTLINNMLTSAGLQGISRTGLILDSNPGIIPEYILPFSGIEFNESGSELQLGVFPNPFTTNLGISYSSSEPKVISIYIYDLAGRLIETIRNGSPSTGENTVITWSPESIIPPGCYLVAFVTESKTIVKRAIRLR